ncbi:hypothetical protein J6590_094866 [Homalodisca vitripennis]|nr:hypothetical protein J6590_094866 [Homalodisca vitripennis]
MNGRCVLPAPKCVMNECGPWCVTHGTLLRLRFNTGWEPEGSQTTSPADRMALDKGPFVFRLNDNGTGPNLLLQVDAKGTYAVEVWVTTHLDFN